MTTLEETKQALQDFLNKHPQTERQAYQKEIDEIMKKTPDDKKLEVLLIMLAQKTEELSNEVNKLLLYH